MSREQSDELYLLPRKRTEAEGPEAAAELERVIAAHEAHPPAEYKTIGPAFFDPRVHCSICSKRRSTMITCGYCNKGQIHKYPDNLGAFCDNPSCAATWTWPAELAPPADEMPPNTNPMRIIVAEPPAVDVYVNPLEFPE